MKPRGASNREGDIIEEEKNQYKVGQSHKAGLLLDDTTSQTPVSETNNQTTKNLQPNTKLQKP